MNACCFLVALGKMSMFRPRKVFFSQPHFPSRTRLAAKHGLAEHVWAVEAVPGMAQLALDLVCLGVSQIDGKIFQSSKSPCFVVCFPISSVVAIVVVVVVCGCGCCCCCCCCCCCYIFSWIDIAWNRFLFTKARSPGNKMVCRRRCGYDGGMCGMVNLFVFLTRCILPPKKGEHNGGFDPPNNGRALALFMSWLLWSVIMHIYVSCLCIIRKFWKFLNDESAEHTKRLWLICRPWPPWQWTKYSSWEIEMSFEPYLKDDRYCI